MAENEITEENLTGIINSIAFRNEANSFTVLELNCEGELVTAVGQIGDCVTGEELILSGKWVTNQTYGRQFSFTQCRRSLPDDSAKLYRYLAGGAIKGIGPKLAAKITAYFGDDTFDILENHPERLQAVSGISAKKAIEIGADFRKNFAVRKLLIELENLGISPSECSEVYKLFGANSIAIVRENPYILCDTIPGFSFERSEEINKLLGLGFNPSYRLPSGILYILRHNTYKGHTCVPVEKLTKTACDFLSATEDEITSAIENLILTHRVVIDTINDCRFAYLPDLYIAEKRISAKLNFVTKFPPSYLKITQSDIEELEKRNGIKYENKQREAIITAVEKGIIVLTGGPGTGKTTTVKGIINVFESKGLDILLCAPTGRAAKRLSEITGRDAKTIHRLLEIEFNDKNKYIFGKNKENPLKAGALIIDEMSMVDTELCAALFDAVPIGCRIIIVGDSDQLPSVGPGNVLNDIIKSGLVPVVCLTEIFRQAQSSLIVMNAHALMNDKEMDLTKKDSDFFMMKRTTVTESKNLICDLVCKRLPEAYGYGTFEDIQVLCPSKMGECGTASLNRRLQELLNPPHKKKAEVKGPGGVVFREGDKVMQTRNNYTMLWKKGKEEGEGIFNGDIGIIESIKVAGGYLIINFDERITEYPIDNLNELDFAYALTIHKSQGSEYPAVIIPVIDCPPKLLYRNLLYTAITRARNILIIVGNEEKIRQMSKDVRQNKRYSGLLYFLKNNENTI